MVAPSIMGFPFGPVAHPSAGALAPAVTDPLRRYQKAAKPFHAMSKVFSYELCDCALADSSLVCGRRRVDEVLSLSSPRLVFRSIELEIGGHPPVLAKTTVSKFK